MATKSVVDTHSLIWYLEGSPKLGRKAEAVLNAPQSELILPIIALAEAIFTVEKKKMLIPDIATLINRVRSEERRVGKECRL